MNWEEIKIVYKDYITEICNKKSENETITFWNGCMIIKYNSQKDINYTLLRVKEPKTLINSARIKIGKEWPLKSKLKYKPK